MGRTWRKGRGRCRGHRDCLLARARTKLFFDTAARMATRVAARAAVSKKNQGALRVNPSRQNPFEHVTPFSPSPAHPENPQIKLMDPCSARRHSPFGTPEPVETTP